MQAKTAEGGTISFLDLFSGIGAMRLGFERACGALGYEPKCLGFSEIDGRATATYLRHFPGTAALGDIRTIASSLSLPECDVLHAGFPCPAFSSAGRRQGFDDERGRLFFSLVKVIEAAKPQAILLENVKGLMTHDKGRTLQTMLTMLKDLGYTLHHAVLNSRNFGVPQNRPRIYIVGFRTGGEGYRFPSPTDSTKRLADALESGQVDPRHYLTDCYLAGIRRHRARQEAKGNGFGYRIIDPECDVAAALVCGGMGRDRNLIVDHRLTEFPVLPRRKSPISRECVRRLTPLECEHLQGLPAGYTEGQTDGHCYRQLGNAITLPVVEAISRNLLAAMRPMESDACPANTPPAC